MSIKDFIPMSETAYYILLSLTEERHGYAVMQYVSKLTNERINLGPGTLYGTLSKLEKTDLVMITKQENKRKYYKITEQGEEVLEAEIQRIEELYTNGREVFSNGRK
ncbi:PadR family transcriptional regulator [Clostridium carboxidivorans P7]|uniref:Transcriptional regulator, PadR-like family n=1 Tax=Clostridium carboxidivorans P7 TaxID=536227 RepID=C6PVU8_9CLOT|nr:PadR family transcriptional regulator [Clostridium carboxidivorans]AKN30145.1 PadR family transcriptional regulator [Clostridium carboxidivorans P7]EET86645.1 transcriptional regulator, PadR-like family [Clostridium carboxidivorans P7]